MSNEILLVDLKTFLWFLHTARDKNKRIVTEMVTKVELMRMGLS